MHHEGTRKACVKRIGDPGEQEQRERNIPRKVTEERLC